MITKNTQGTNISQSFINAITDSVTPYIVKILLNGTELVCDIKKVVVTKGSVANENDFNVGSVVGSQMVAEVLNLTTAVKNKELELQVGLNDEFITIGKFTASEVINNTNSTTITGYGSCISKTTGDFTSPQDMTPPQTLSIANIIAEIQRETGVTINVDSRISQASIFDLPMSGITTYQALQAVVASVGAYAVDTNDGNISIKLFDDTPTLTISADRMVQLMKNEETDFEITGVKVQTAAGEVSSANNINLLATSDYMTLAMFPAFESHIVGYTYRPSNANITIGDPRLEGDDVLTIYNADGNSFVVPCHYIVHTFSGGLSTEVTSATATQLANDIATPRPLSEAVWDAIQKAEEALKAVEDIGDTSEYFWHTTTDTGAGAGSHITQIPQAEFLADPNNGGGNTLIDSSGMTIRDGLEKVARFVNTEDGSQLALGKDDGSQSYLYADYHSLRLIDKEGDPYVYFSDLRNSEGVYEGTTEYEIKDNTDIGELFFIFDVPVSEIVSVTCNGAALSYEPRLPEMVRIDSSSLSIGDIIIIVFKSTDRLLKAFTFGQRRDGEPVGLHSFAFGDKVTASGYFSHAEGSETTASGGYSHAEGYSTKANGDASHAEGLSTKANGRYSHAEGARTNASGDYAHAEGTQTTASGNVSHAEGLSTTASGDDSHAEGSWTTASGRASHAEGSSTNASGYASHAEGSRTNASGYHAHAEGQDSTASGLASHAQNYHTIAEYMYQTAIGKYNNNKSTSAFEIGNGTAESARSNALQVDWNGMVSLTGNRNINGSSQEVIVPYFNLGTGLTPTQVADGIVKKIVELYGTSDYVNTRFKGRAQASSNLYYDFYIYDPTDKQKGLPKYSFGSMYRYGGTEYRFGTQTYALYVNNVVANGVPNTVTSYDNTKFTYEAGFGPYSKTDSTAPCADKFGRIVTLSGAFKATAAQTSTGQKTIGKVPAGCEPLRTLRVVEQGSGSARFLLTINPSGVLMAERYSSNGTDTAMPNGAWLNIFATYISKT